MNLSKTQLRCPECHCFISEDTLEIMTDAWAEPGDDPMYIAASCYNLNCPGGGTERVIASAREPYLSVYGFR